jgi:hypothetical protein
MYVVAKVDEKSSQRVESQQPLRHRSSPIADGCSQREGAKRRNGAVILSRCNVVHGSSTNGGLKIK